jgi:hypothetical protein
MSYVPTPPPPEEPVNEPGSRRETWFGVAAGIAACLGLPFLSLSLSDSMGFLGFGVMAPLVVLVAGVVLVIPDRTRRWGTGLLMGFAISLVLGAGACVILLASWNGG